MIDVLTSDKDIQCLLDETLHMRQDAITDQLFQKRNDAEPDDLPSIPNMCPFFLCQKHPLFLTMNTLIKNFWHFIKQHRLGPGHLLMFSVEGSENQQESVYFLGTMLKKPLQQILIEAEIASSEVQFKLINGRPNILTAHELFLSFIRDEDASAVVIQVEAWKCDAFFDSGHVLKTNASVSTATFSLTTARLPSNRKKQPALPFGLKMAPKPRQKRSKTNRTIEGRKAKKQKPPAFLPEEVIDLDTESDIAENGSADSSSSSVEDEDAELDGNQESETVVPPLAVVATEQVCMQDVAQEIETADRMREEKSETIRLDKASSSSFF